MLNKRSLVVGYKGEIGSFILQRLIKVLPKAADIYCCDINESEAEVIDRIRMADVIYLCIPLDQTVDWLFHYKAWLTRDDKIVIEQCSLKEDIFNAHKVKGIDLRGMHCLFRPSVTPDRTDRTIGFIYDHWADTNVADLADKLFDSRSVMWEDVEEHDTEMALQQALVHRTLKTLGVMLSKEGSNTTYMGNRVLELYTRMLKGDEALYKKIQENPHLDVWLKEFKERFDSYE